MKITLIEPKHRCKKCKTPLEFENNYVRSKEELEKFKTKELEKASWIKKLFIYRHWWEGVIDTNRQYWKCPKCFEEYLVTLK